MPGSSNRSKRKGLVNIIYVMGLILMATISLAYIVPFISQQPDTNVVEIAINNRIFLLRDSLEIAKQYIDSSASFSLYQAMYDNGREGGLDGTGDSASMEHLGESYSLWYDNKDTSPDESDVKEALERSFGDNFDEYTGGKTVKALALVSTPTYRKVEITNHNGVSVGLEATSSADLAVRDKTEGGDDIVIERSSGVFLNFSVPYFWLFSEAGDYHDIMHEPFEDRLVECDKSEIERSIDRPGFTLEATVLDTSDGSCLVKVEAETKKSYPVWNGSESVLDKIRLVFMERRGPEQARLCMTEGILNVRCKETCDDDEYPSRTVFKDKDECIRALEGKVTDFSDDEHFSASQPEPDTLVLSQITGISVVDLLKRFPEGAVEAEHMPPMSRLATIPGSAGEYRIMGISEGDNTKLFCELKGLYHECFGLDSPLSSGLDEREKEFVSQEALRYADASKDCGGEVIPSGPWSIHLALSDLGIQASLCEINEKRKPGIVSLSRFLSALGEDAMPIMWPDQLASVIRGYGVDVDRRTGDDDELRGIAIEEAGKADKAVIIRVSLDERNQLLSQHYEFVRKNQDGRYNYLEAGEKPIEEIYIISKETA